ncbi:MAG: ABC transporter ATP-binding protein [Rhodocyclaceae bacterium]|jgi:putative spermidine/putrescine transport system ATP-binding protein|nr:ABC transporter ATP-binding protein [Rhodocyclaceae bacterium]MCA3074529.1 ABC transporter ATP-binding protein [Rhodocyclaceae bacterium]MCA3089539.1 ABC transporter ATP-binding protein [Rhodocyclaceae bacterium]MCA3093100.1 ABC transporter ATP-binding protein [Rhodocyclaceae bacterium]MCA3096809.1 ABC transporter ATP-binding protein [Rhodocyclaceae bacterium]
MQSETPPNDDRSSSAVVLDRVTHRYGAFTAVQDIQLEIRAGEFLALLGPSGCGKTTLLRIVAGLIRQSEGHVTIGGEIVDALPPNERGAGIVFQSYALFPHMTVAANIEYGLRARGMPKAERAGVVERMLALVRMREHAARYPRQLSGGQQQRVALARTLAVSPKVLLLDEPFGALDKNLRLGMQIEVKRLQRELGITTVMVTHDQEEALGMADRIAVMSEGRVEQLGTPEQIYDRPRSLFVAHFVGTANLFGGRLEREGDRFAVQLAAGGRLQLDDPGPCSRPGQVSVSVRPEHLVFVPPADGTINATVEFALPLGPTVVHELALDNGDRVKVTVARTGAHAWLAPGTRTGLAVAPGAPVAVFQA